MKKNANIKIKLVSCAIICLLLIISTQNLVGEPIETQFPENGNVAQATLGERGPDITYFIELKYGWNLISLPINETIAKNDLTINYSGVEYTWADAAASKIVMDIVYWYNATSQLLEESIVLKAGFGYWLFTYYDCTLLAEGASQSGGYWTQVGNDIYYNLGNVGIGTENPDAGLHIFEDLSEYALRIENNASLDRTYGIHTTVDSPRGRAIYAYATNATTSEPTFGVFGVTESSASSSCGVRGESRADSGYSYGVYGISSSRKGRGVVGIASRSTASAENTVGVYGESRSQEGYGVVGTETSDRGYTYGVFGKAVSPNGTGIFGWAANLSGSNFGVVGKTDSTNGTGVYGVATNNSSVGRTYGVYGHSESESDGSCGVVGVANATDGSIAGVYGLTYSKHGKGIMGVVSRNSGVNFGVYGASKSDSGRGVAGYATSDDGSTIGVYGQSYSPNGTGIYGLVNSPLGSPIAVRGKVDCPFGYAGFFEGRVNITENLTTNGFVMPTNAFLNYVLTSDEDGKGTWQPAFGGNTLDAAYDQGGPGAGREIIADSGPVNISGPDGLVVNGSVGIGTTDPLYPMDLGNSIGKKLALYYPSTMPALFKFFGFGVSSRIGSGEEMDTLEFHAGTDENAAEDPQMVLNTDGYVGINNTTPETELQVDGTVTATAFVGDGSKLRNIPHMGPQILYAESGFDSSASAGSSDQSNTEIGTISSADLSDCSYLKIEITGTVNVLGYKAQSSEVQLRIQTKPLSLGYSTSLDYTTIKKSSVDVFGIPGGSVSASQSSTFTFTYYHTLTSQEKTNGVGIKLWSISLSSTNTESSFTNLQTVVTPV